MRDCIGIHPDPRNSAFKCRLCREAILRPAEAPAPAVPDPCKHLGGAARLAMCQEAGQVGMAPLRRCAVHGECSPDRVLSGVASCLTCQERESAAPSRVAPLGLKGQASPWEGSAVKKSWHYRATAVLPHLDTVDLLHVLVDLLRLQTDPPYIMVIDTGSPDPACRRLEAMRADDLEVHYLKGHGYCHASEPVSIALDLGLNAANTEYLFLTHTDCFPMRRDAVSWLVGQCTAACPVVGWEMSERAWATKEWEGMVSHTFTALHAPTMRRVGATWNLQRGRELLGYDRFLNLGGWPDTETGFGAVLRGAGIKPKLLGRDLNYVRQKTEWWDHARSITGTRVYGQSATAETATAANRCEEAYREALARVQRWRADDLAARKQVASRA